MEQTKNIIKILFENFQRAKYMNYDCAGKVKRPRSTEKNSHTIRQIITYHSRDFVCRIAIHCGIQPMLHPQQHAQKPTALSVQDFDLSASHCICHKCTKAVCERDVAIVSG
ncbi:hypothetical protein AVEN_121373-1 [Araneus ventricosus]|uniref:Uncharacterized protein n=1 Tax=Araneus ventricosus TaxID=182803 RepID=A0A4Y2CQA1_ARAVE|nr:hypothetical protein AVEN_121373-1 [Araneus ventricosus]